MRTIRWGIIGVGDATERLSGPGFQKAENSALVAVMRRTPHLAEDYARRHNVPRWSDNADDLINANDIDAIYVATHPNTHCEYTLRAAAAGKHVYVEKPMGMNSEECERMIAACRKAGVSLWVAHYRRALPRYARVRELIGDGAIGAVRTVRTDRYALLDFAKRGNPPAFDWRVDPTRCTGGYFFEGVCHTLDILDQYFGPIEQVHGFSTNTAGAYEPPDLVTGVYRFASGVIGGGTWCYASDRTYEATEIVGEKGRLFFTMQDKPLRLVRGDKAEDIVVADPPHAQQPLIQTIVDELNGKGHCPSTAESGARAVRVMERIMGL
jgi:predicted dehydrogenase